jgi:nucleotide-binding universal stress UspA family protein
MAALARLLLVVDRSDRARTALNKTMLLARYFGANVRIFLCETERYGAHTAERPFTPITAGATTVDSEAHDYVAALTRSISSSDVEVSSAAVHCPSLPQAVLAECANYQADLIVVAAPSRAGVRLTGASSTWQKVVEGDVPVLVTHGQPWNPTPKFAAIVESTDLDEHRATAAIARLSTMFANRCQAELDVLVSSTAQDLHPETADWRRWWTALARDDLAAHASCRTLTGELGLILPRLVQQQEYDLVVLGRSRSTEGANATIAAKVIASSGSDVLLVGSRPVDEARPFPGSA